MKKTSTRIALLDDKSFGLIQIKNALPGKTLEVVYFSTFVAFQQSTEHFDILLLDYYLDKDDLSSDMVFDQICPRAKTIIAFSSSVSANERLLRLGADFAVQKLWEDKNEHLENLMMEIL